MNACAEATQLIMSLTQQVAALKQMSTTENIQRGEITSIGENILQAWMKGEAYSEVLHARWVEATDPKTIEKKFKTINKEFQKVQKEKRDEEMMTPEEKEVAEKEKAADALTADTKLEKAKHNRQKHEQKVVDDEQKQKKKEK